MNAYWKARLEIVGGVEKFRDDLKALGPRGKFGSMFEESGSIRLALDLASLALDTLTRPPLFGVKPDPKGEPLQCEPGTAVTESGTVEMLRCENCTALLEAVDVVLASPRTARGVFCSPQLDVVNHHKVPSCDMHALEEAAAKARL